MRIIEHGSHQTLGIVRKGVPVYETFAFARHIMNRTLYFHKRVATFECMMEEVLRLMVSTADPQRLPVFLRLLTGSELAKTGQVDDSILDEYLQLTEDQVWVALASVSQRGDRLGKLARGLLARQCIPSRLVSTEKQDVLLSVLRSEGFSEEQCRIRSLPSQIYSQKSEDQVFVHDSKKPAPVHLSEVSSLVDQLRDRTDAPAILVIFDESSANKIISVAHAAGCLHDHAPEEATGPTITKGPARQRRRPIAKGQLPLTPKNEEKKGSSS